MIKRLKLILFLTLFFFIEYIYAVDKTHVTRPGANVEFPESFIIILGILILLCLVLLVITGAYILIIKLKKLIA
jgi:hypothetical protein